MKLQMPLLAVCLAALAPAVLAQDDDPVPPKFGGQPPIEKPITETPFTASDGKPVAPGRIPEDTTPSARDRWNKILAGTRIPGVQAAPIQGFDMSFEIATEGNEFAAHYKFKAKEKYLSFFLPRSSTKRVMLRGPKGDFLIEEGVAEKLGGRGNTVGPKQLDDWTAIARNFIALSDPKAIRIVSLKTLPAMTLPLPTESSIRNLPKLAKQLSWLEMRSPDFQLYNVDGPGKRTGIFRALLGVNQETGAVELAILSEDHKELGLHFSTMLVDISRRNKIDGYIVPGRMQIWKVEYHRGQPTGFGKWEAVDLSLLEGGSLKPAFGENVFLPPPG